MFTNLFTDKTTARALSTRTPEQALYQIMRSKRLAPFRILRSVVVDVYVID
jgi:hypothetical protein